MEQREVQDNEGTIWVCVQAYGGLEGKKGEKAAEIAEDKNRELPVVCTPNGGAQSVRIQLPTDWMERLSDSELLAKINSSQ